MEAERLRGSEVEESLAPSAKGLQALEDLPRWALSFIWLLSGGWIQTQPYSVPPPTTPNMDAASDGSAHGDGANGLGLLRPHGPSSTARRRPHSWRPIVRADAADLVSLSIRQKVLPGLFLLPLHIARLLPGSLSTTRPHDATTPHHAPSTTRSDDNHQLPT